MVPVVVSVHHLDDYAEESAYFRHFRPQSFSVKYTRKPSFRFPAAGPRPGTLLPLPSELDNLAPLLSTRCYLTGFSDVNGHAYYGKAISWAKQAGIVNGYGDGTFRPDANATREEFAAMLANFAKKYNSFTDVDADKVLGEFSDGASVSDWAEEVVAWAVDSEIMGNGGFIAPTAQITRAEAAAMVVNSKLAL